MPIVVPSRQNATISSGMIVAPSATPDWPN
jgi:hypothetical protein